MFKNKLWFIFFLFLAVAVSSCARKEELPEEELIEEEPIEELLLEEPIEELLLEEPIEELLLEVERIEDVQIEGILLLDHFNDARKPGKLGNFGAWDKDHTDFTQTCYDSFAPLEKRGDRGYSLRVDYDVDSPNPAFNGLWFELGGIDLDEYKYLVFWVKGDTARGFTEVFKVELKNSIGEKGIYYVTGVTDEWQQIVISLKRFMGISHFDNMVELVIVFEDWRVTEKEGTLYFDDIYFSKAKLIEEPLVEIFPTLRDRIPRPDISEMSDDEFLDFVQQKKFLFFWKETNPETGLTKDRANNFQRDTYIVSSIASVGFALTAYPIAVERGWLTREAAYERTLNTLKFFRDEMENVHGFYYHFVDMNTGKRVWQCELSSIDTALFLAGALFAGEYFGGEIKRIANELYLRVDWEWMLGGGDTLVMGWYPETGFCPNRWNKYAEQLILLLMAIGSPTHPIPAYSWDLIVRNIWTYAGIHALVGPPLFLHQYSHAWVDFRNKHDRHVDYFQSSINATLINRQFCIDVAKRSNSRTFSENVWGLTASDGPASYRAYGAPPGHAFYDGTVASHAAGGSIVFTPEYSIASLRYVYNRFKDNVWGKYGFISAFNIDRQWWSEDVIGIDQGIILLMIENYRSGLIWNYFMRNDHIRRAMRLVGFRRGTKELKPTPRSLVTAKKLTIDINKRLDKNKIDLLDWYELIPRKHLEWGGLTKANDLSASFVFLWDEDYLYLLAKVIDNEIFNTHEARYIYRGDCVELFLVPQDARLHWGHPEHFQFGFSPTSASGEPAKWAWFQERDIQEVLFNAYKENIQGQNGYIVMASIPWSVINLEPHSGLSLAVSVAVRDKDKEDNTPDCKLQLDFRPLYEKGTAAGFSLGKLVLK